MDGVFPGRGARNWRANWFAREKIGRESNAVKGHWGKRDGRRMGWGMRVDLDGDFNAIKKMIPQCKKEKSKNRRVVGMAEKRDEEWR